MVSAGSGGLTLAALALVWGLCSASFISETEKPIEDLLSGMLVTSDGHGICDEEGATSITLGGKVEEIFVALGDSVLIPCNTREFLRRLGLDSNHSEICWLHRPSMRGIREGRRTLGPSFSLHRHQLEPDSGGLWVGSAQKDDDGTFDCLVRSTSQEGYLARTRLHVEDCGAPQGPCYSGTCKEYGHPDAKHINCTCIASGVYYGTLCDKKKESKTKWYLLYLMPVLVPIVAVVVVAYRYLFCYSRRPRLALTFIRRPPLPIDSTQPSTATAVSTG